ncbi:MAG TPA: alpha/beta hydrolase [Anaerolineales bacterium]|nr:alpha/beta hydrolase [Anaerolineales bacterium]
MKRVDDKWKAEDGTTFFVHGWEPENGSPRALVVLVHGLGEHTARYAHVGKVLSKSGYALVGFDLRGHGKSGGARGHISSLDVIMQDIGQFFRLMEDRYPDIPRFLYGHSLGGLLALTYGILHGAHLRGVIATGAGLRSSLQEQKAKVAIARLLGLFLPTMTLPSGLDAATISRDPAIVEAYRKDVLVHDRVSLGLGNAALSAIDLCFARAREFAVPLLLMHGKEDKIAYFGGSEDFAELLRAAGRDVTFKLWDGFYHEVHNEPGNEDVFLFMVEWLNQYV